MEYHQSICMMSPNPFLASPEAIRATHAMLSSSHTDELVPPLPTASAALAQMIASQSAVLSPLSAQQSPVFLPTGLNPPLLAVPPLSLLPARSSPAIVLDTAQAGPTVIPSAAKQTKSPPKMLGKRERFFLFIKFLFKCIKPEDVETRQRAKIIVAECTRRNRMGNPGFSSLVDAVEKHLRGVVGEKCWKQATNCVERYIRARNVVLMKKSKELK